MELSISTNIFRDIDAELAMEMLLKTSFRCFELGHTHFEQLSRVDNWDYKKIQRISHNMSQFGAYFYQMHAPFFSLADDDAKENKYLCEVAMGFAKEIGIQWVVFHPFTTPGWDKEKGLEKWMKEENLLFFQKMQSLAIDYQVGVAIENLFDNRFGSNPEDLQWLLDELSFDVVGICWDTSHGKLKFPDQVKIIRNFAKNIVALHVSDNRGISDDHLLPYRGVIEWDSLVKVLTTLPVPFNFELPGERCTSPVSVRSILVEYGFQLGKYMLQG